MLDKLNTAIKGYLTSIDPVDLDDVERRRLDEILILSTNLEQARDVVDRNLLAHAAKRLKLGLAFSKAGGAELIAMLDRLIVNLRTAACPVLERTEELLPSRIADAAVSMRWSHERRRLTLCSCMDFNGFYRFDFLGKRISSRVRHKWSWGPATRHQSLPSLARRQAFRFESCRKQSRPVRKP